MSLIDIKNLSFAYDGSAEKVFDNVSFQIDTGWRLGFTGRNGRGKTTFLKLLMGELTPPASPQASALITSRSRCMTRRAPRRKRSRRS